MATLDYPPNLPNPSTVPVRPTALRYGLIGGLLLVVLSLALNLTGMVDYTHQGGTGNTLAAILQYGVMIAVVVLAIKKHRDEDLGRFISFGRCLGVGTLTSLILGIVGAVWAYLYFGIIDPGLVEQIREMAHDKAIEGGSTEAQMEQAKGIMDFFTSPVFFSVASLFGAVIVGFIVSLIAGAIMKKEPPQMG